VDPGKGMEKNRDPGWTKLDLGHRITISIPDPQHCCFVFNSVSEHKPDPYDP
jgi:hypothetical protein